MTPTVLLGAEIVVYGFWPNIDLPGDKRDQRLADPDHHREAITSRPLLLQAIGRQTNHAGRATVTISSSHGDRDRARRALTRIAAFFATLRETAEQLTDLDRWYRILSHALVKYLKGRQLDPPRRLQAA